MSDGPNCALCGCGRVDHKDLLARIGALEIERDLYRDEQDRGPWGVTANAAERIKLKGERDEARQLVQEALDYMDPDGETAKYLQAVADGWREDQR